MTRSTDLARSFLFVPGDRPERFDKAIASGADIVILDLEDSIAPNAKAQALTHVLAWLDAGGRAAVRVNGVGTEWHTGEIEALGATRAIIVLPKAESASELINLSRRLGPLPRIIALIETARGVRDVDAVADVEGVIRIALGNVDLSTELGVDPASHAALAYARGRLVVTSAAAGLPAPVDGVTTALNSEQALADDIDNGRQLGFGGKLCIHPHQVEPVNRSFLPTPDELAWAHRVLAPGNNGGVRVLDGKMIDPPVVRRAERLINSLRNL